MCGWVDSAGWPGLLAIKGLLWWELSSEGMFTRLIDWPSYSDRRLVSKWCQRCDRQNDDMRKTCC